MTFMSVYSNQPLWGRIIARLSRHAAADITQWQAYLDPNRGQADLATLRSMLDEQGQLKFRDAIAELERLWKAAGMPGDFTSEFLRNPDFMDVAQQAAGGKPMMALAKRKTWK